MRIFKLDMLTEITTTEVKIRYPKLGEVGVKLTKDYIDLTVSALKIRLIEEKELQEIESRYKEMEHTIEKLQYLCADILTLLKTLVNEIKVPEDSIEFEEWKEHSMEYPKVVCHDAFFDIFILSNQALSKGWD